MRLIIRTITCVVVSLGYLMPLSAIANSPETPDQSCNACTEPVGEDKSPKDKEPAKKPREHDGGKDEVTKERNEKPVRTRVVTKPEPEANVFPVHTKANYCPAGLQPVTISGSISCGSPNTHVTYPQMMTHPQTTRVKKKHRVSYQHSALPSCSAGTKGCSDR